MTHNEKIETVKKLAVELQSGNPLILVGLTPSEAFALIAGIQLACRHPNFHGPTRETVEQIARNVQEKVSEDRPTVADIAEKGWNPENDLPLRSK